MLATQQDASVETLPRVPVFRLVGHEGPIQKVQFSCDGRYVLTGGHDRSVRLWNPLRRDPACTISTPFKSQNDPIPLQDLPHSLPIQSYTDGHTHPISAIHIDGKSTTLLSSSNKSVVVTDLVTTKLKRRLHGHTGEINTLCTSIGCETFLSGSYDSSVKIWDGRSWSANPIQTLNEATDSISCVQVYTNGHEKDTSSGDITDDFTSQIITASIDGKIRTYDLRKGQIKVDDFGSRVAITSMSTTSDGLCHVALGLDGQTHIIERSSGDMLLSFHGDHTAGQYALDCSITADDNSIVCGSEDGKAFIYDFTTGRKRQTLVGHFRPTTSVACHPSRKQSSIVITASYDGNAVIWTNGNEVIDS